MLSPSLVFYFCFYWFTFCTINISLRLIHTIFLGQIVHQFGTVLGILSMNPCVFLPAVVNSGLICPSQTLTVLSRAFHGFIAMGSSYVFEIWRTSILPFSLPFLLLIITVTFQSLTLLPPPASPWMCPVSCLINDHSLQTVQLSTHMVHYP